MTIAPIISTPPQPLSNPEQPVEAVSLDAKVTAIRTQTSAEETQQAEPAAEKQQPALDAIENTVSDINDFVQNLQRDLRFQLTEDGSRTIIYVINSETEEVIRQIPPEELQAISESLSQQVTDGLLLTTKT